MEVKPGYKLTDVGVIPEEWEVSPLSGLFNITAGGDVDPKRTQSFQDAIHCHPIYSNALTNSGLYAYCSYADHPADSITITARGMVGGANLRDHPYTAIGRVLVLQPKSEMAGFYFVEVINNRVKFANESTGVPQLTAPQISKYRLPVPSLPEQHAIATALSDVDGLLGGLDRLIAKKRDLKRATMQQLLTCRTRLPGFHGDWPTKTLNDVADCFDNLRVPLNEAQRARRKGDYPYCGANGILDFVDGFVVDDDIILIAEDGGYFDEYETRPIAYRMTGKCWVNNHAHILKAKAGFDQGFVFYSLVHKNVLPFLASGTRAKLNKTEMKKIEIRLPEDEHEQTAIAEVLTDMDADLTGLEHRREKTRDLKQAMMQELLTGRTRLVSPKKAHA